MGITEKPDPRRSAAELKQDTGLVTLLRSAVDATSDEDGWAPLAAVGNIILKRRPDFDARNYGYPKLSGLIEATTLFQVDRCSVGAGKPAVVYVLDDRQRTEPGLRAGQ
ncbi:OST-HTH/LOTUS domain-containing protein [Amycolatopsis mongoliensis]|uniref:OST-HTH/LOTUS domain-containing protein n=1 Tax=Amycolatopsis mongoliensis TaxID=715475 RepID=A0A9Y2NDX2_9PSEU|nr:OST-HTH/LOTUS domain-containing protein [Amycolatopsis sp. 4-36]WIY01172.1 OST-HTH/LOTUS domain-containing protein [Amycolatopsis sp. 4-36]